MPPYYIIYLLGTTRTSGRWLVTKWPKDYEVLTVRNVTLVALIMLGPLLIMIAFLNN